MNKSAKELEKIGKKTPQLAIENTQPAVEDIQNQPSVVFDTSSEKPLMNMKKKDGFFKTDEDQEHGCLWKGKPTKKVGGTRLKIEDKGCDFNDAIQKDFHDTKKICKR